MRYWFYDEKAKRATGPHLDITLAKQTGFGPDAKVAPEGARQAHEWKPAKDVPELAAFLVPKP